MTKAKAMRDTPTEAMQDARDALQAMMDAWFDYHDAHSLTQPVTGAAGGAFEKALAARDKLDTAMQAARSETEADLDLRMSLEALVAGEATIEETESDILALLGKQSLDR